MRTRRKLAVRAALAVGSAVVPAAAHAAVIVVDSTADTVALDSQCTLREALLNANDDALTSPDCDVAGSGPDVIDLGSLGPAATILLGGTGLTITSPLTITGPGQTDLTIDANGLSRVFLIADGDSGTAIDVQIEDVTLTNGTAVDGGAVYSEENLTLSRVTVSGSSATSAGGGLRQESASSGGTLDIVDSTFQTNDAAYGGAVSANESDVVISGSTFDLNTASGEDGGISLVQSDFITLTDSTITNNYSAGLGGGGSLWDAEYIVIDGTTISGNEAVGLAGGLYLYATLTSIIIENSVISGNQAGTYSGGLHISDGSEASVEIRDTEISGNSAGTDAGGLYLYDMGEVTIERLKLTGNTAANEFGGAALWGVYATIAESQISGNQAPAVGGLYVAYGSYLYLSNSTIANNTATTGSTGGLGISESMATIDVSTISGNSAPAGAAGNIFTYGSTVDIRNSIIADGTAIAGADMVNATSTVTLNYSILENTAGASFTGANNSNADPQLGPLQNNGGPTETMKPAPASPAVNAGDPAFTTPAIDQRGFLRPIGVVDMGAVEVNPGTLAISAPAAVSEGAGFVTVTVTRTGGSDGAAAVDYTTGGGTATSGADFTLTTGTLNWADGDSTSKSFNVLITDDLIFEGTEQFSVTLSNAVNAALGAAVASIDITDNDGPPTISINSSSATEGGSVVFDVTLSNPTTQTVTVDFTTAGVDATSGVDFTANSGTLTFNPLVTTQQITVMTTQDAVDEPNETFNVNLTNPNANATILDGSGVGTINDDDATPTISINNAGQTEGGNVVFDVTLSGASSQTITVDFTTAGVDATSGVDFTANSGTLTFNPLVTTQQITVVTIQDPVDEPNETFNVNLTNPNANATILDGSGVGTINDDDATPTISINNAGQTEGGNVVFDVTLSGASSQTITVDFATAGVDATSGVDFTANSGTLTFNPLVTTQQITVVTAQDAFDEPNETFNVNLTNPSANATILAGTGVGTIVDDDGAPALNIGDVTLAEGNAGPTSFLFTVTLLPSSGQTVTVDYTTADVSATAGSDYTTTAGTLTFTPGDTSETITVPVGGDTSVEANEIFNVVLSNAPLATIADGTAAGTITNDDVLPVLNIGDVSQAEGTGGTTNFLFTVTLSPSSGDTVTVSYTTQNGSATSGSDYTTTAGTLTFNPGDTSETITVPVSPDPALEPDETFDVVLSAATMATIADGTGLGTITNDDTALADLSLSKAVVGPGPYTVGQNETFTITITNAGPDAAANATVTDILPAGTVFVSATPSSGSCSGTTTVVCNVGTLANGGSATVTLTVQLTAAGTVTNTATGASDAGDLSPATGSATFTVSAPAVGDSIPTLSQWMLIALAAALACLGVRRP